MVENGLTLETGATEIAREKPDNIVIFDASGRIVTRVGTDIPFQKKTNFFELLSEEEREFFVTWRQSFATKKLLLETSRGPMVVFCAPFAETGVYVAVLFHTPRETVRDLWRLGFWSDMRVSPTLEAKTLPRKRGNEEEIPKIAECVGRLTAVFDRGVERLPLRDGDWILSLLSLMLCNLAQSFGCALSVQKARRVLLSEAWAFSVPSFAAVMACLMSLAATASVDGKARVEIFEEDGRIFVCFYTTLAYWRDKRSKGHTCAYSELEDCARIAERHDLFLDLVLTHKEENADLMVRFSPEYADVATLGFKHPLGFRE